MKNKISLNKKNIEIPIKGTLFTPANKEDTKQIALILLPGSDGGIPELIAESIAKNGYSTLALGYFGIEGMPQHLESIALEYFQTAITWLKNEIQTEKIVLMGYSRGGELVLILGSLFPDLMHGIIAHVPSSNVNGGFPHNNRPAWTVNDNPIHPFVQGLMSKNPDFSEMEDLFEATKNQIIPFHENSANDPYEIVELYYQREKTKATKECAIPVENIRCPLLILAGEEDKIWPSSLYGKQIIERLDQKHSKILRQLFTYKNAGHGFIANYKSGPIYHPIGKFWCTLGGTPEGNRMANRDSWQKIHQFLNSII